MRAAAARGGGLLTTPRDVYKARERATGDILALKIIDFENAEDDVEDIQKEIRMLSQCNSAHITKYFGSHLQGSKLYIAMEFMAGGAVEKLMKPKPFEEQYVAVLMREGTQLLRHLPRSRHLPPVLKGLEYVAVALACGPAHVPQGALVASSRERLFAAHSHASAVHARSGQDPSVRQ